MSSTGFKPVFILVFVFLFSYIPSKAQEYPTEKEHKWAGKYYFRVFEEKFPIPENRNYLIGYRMYKDLYLEIENSFEIFENAEKKNLSASVKIADGAPLYEQIIMIRRKNPSASLEQIKSQLKIKQWLINEETCPAIKGQYDEFNQLSLEMLSEKDRDDQNKGIVTITLHPRIYTFKSHISGGTMTLTLRDSEHRFVKWAEKTRKEFEVCTEPQNK